MRISNLDAADPLLETHWKSFNSPLQQAWTSWLDAEQWRFMWTVSLGNGLNVSEAQMREIVNLTALRLKRKLWGNRKKHQRKIDFLAFRQFGDHNKQGLKVGSALDDDAEDGEHWHLLLHIRGDHGWSDGDIVSATVNIGERRSAEKKLNALYGIRDTMVDKPIHVQLINRGGNRCHGYCARDVGTEQKPVGSMHRNGRLVEKVELRDDWVQFTV